jgi:hypothetical protein
MKTLIELEWGLDGSRMKPELGDEPRIVWLDIETRKIPAVTGWPFKNRWQTFMVGMAAFCDPGVMWLDVLASDDEAELMDAIEMDTEGYEVRYAATHSFDEMVLRGRYLSCYRKPTAEPGRWPNLDRADVRWLNIRKGMKRPSWPRAADVKGVDVPTAWAAGQCELVALHCARDVAENVLGDPDVTLAKSLSDELLRLVCDVNWRP